MKTTMDFTMTPSNEEFAIGLQQSLFYTKIGHEDRSFALNAILAIPPETELSAYEQMTYKKFI